MTVLSTLLPRNGLVPRQDAYRDNVSDLALDIPLELVQLLSDEIVGAYHRGHTPDERSAIAHGTACPQMVEQCNAEWKNRSRNQPLTQLLGIVADAMNQIFKEIDNVRSFCPPQIAVRENVSDDVQFGPHVDGLIKGEETLEPDVPFAVIGVYLDDVSERDDGALVYWPEKAVAVRRATASFSGKALAKALCSIGGTCNFTDPTARSIVGTAGHAYFVGGNVPHCNHPRSVDGKRVAVYFRMYVNTPES